MRTFTDARIEIRDVNLERLIRGFDTVGIALKKGAVVIIHSDDFSKLHCSVESVDPWMYLFECVWLYGMNERPGTPYEHAVKREAQEADLTLVDAALNGR